MKPTSRSISFLLPIILSLATALSSTGGAAEPPPPSPGHIPIYSVTAGRGVPVSVNFEDPAEVVEVRLYFKTMAAKDYLFLPMKKTEGGTYTANLPPARNWSKGIDYLLLRKSAAGQTRKSKPYRLLVMNDFGVPPSYAAEIQVQAEAPSFGGTENHDFAVPLRVTATPEPLLAGAEEDSYPPIAVPGPGGGSSGIFGGLGGVSFSIKVGGVSFRYGSFSGR